MASLKKPLSKNVRDSASKKTKQLPLLHLVEKAFLRFNQSPKKMKSMTVAFSGGVDSVVLLHLLHQLQKKYHFTLKASHVHHGLSEYADQWVKFCEALCRKWTIDLQVHHIQLPKKKSFGIEGEARRLRYEKLLQSKTDCVVLAHHEDDQAETFLLQLIRGAGVKGLSSMAHFDEDRHLWRPLLNTSRMDIETYAKQHKLKWMEDESNQNIAFDRNFVRLKVLPLLKNRFSHIIKVISRSSSHLAEAQHLLDDLAKIDLKSCLKSIKYKHKLQVKTLIKLSPIRAKNVLRYWLELNGQLMPTKDLLDELLRQVLKAKKDATIKIQLSKAYEIRRYQDEIFIVPKNQQNQKNYEMIWNGESKIILPNGHQLTFKKVKGRGINLKFLNDQTLKMRNRQGGEYFKPDSKRPTKKIKQMLHESNLPPWERENLPLIFVGDQLAFVPHYGIDVKYQVKPQETGLEIKLFPSK